MEKDTSQLQTELDKLQQHEEEMMKIIYQSHNDKNLTELLQFFHDRSDEFKDELAGAYLLKKKHCPTKEDAEKFLKTSAEKVRQNISHLL